MLKMAIISGSGNYKFLNNKIPTKIIKEMRFSLIILRYITTTRIIERNATPWILNIVMKRIPVTSPTELDVNKYSFKVEKKFWERKYNTSQGKYHQSQQCNNIIVKTIYYC